MINLYYVRYQRGYVESYDTLEQAFDDAREHFYEGYSCCQTVIDESEQKIYTLSGDIEIDSRFYNYQHSIYDVIFTDYFDGESIWLLSGTHRVGED